MKPGGLMAACDKRPDFEVGDIVDCDGGEEYVVEKIYEDLTSGWVVDYKDTKGIIRTGFPHIWFKLKQKKHVLPAGQTSQEIKEATWDKCPECNRTMDFISLGYNCPEHGPKQLKSER